MKRWYTGNRSICFILFLTMAACFIGCSGSGGSSHTAVPASSQAETNQGSAPSNASALIIDHTSTDLAKIPAEWIDKARNSLHIAYGHTSHGSQLVTGMRGLVAFKGNLYEYNGTGANGALELRDRPFTGAEDLGNPNFTAWEKATRTYLDANPSINVVIWSWCRQVSDATAGEIETYLDLMSGLEKDYPDVRFVYMTGRLDGTGIEGNLNARNEQIRDYCDKNGKILYDFADIESYDPSGNYYGDRHVTDGCNYDFDNDGTTSEAGAYTALPTGGDRNWAMDWQASHVEGVDWYECISQHTQPVNANQKAYAAWALWARLAGWDGR